MTRRSRRLLSYVLAVGLAFSTAFGPSPALAQSSCDGATAACAAENTDIYCSQQYINDLALCLYCQSLANVSMLKDTSLWRWIGGYEQFLGFA